MRVFILPANTVQEPVIRDGRGTVICVFMSNHRSEELQNFRCLGCGWVVFQFTNKSVEAIVYGNSIPDERNSLDAQCGRCHQIYRVV